MLPWDLSLGRVGTSGWCNWIMCRLPPEASQLRRSLKSYLLIVPFMNVLIFYAEYYGGHMSGTHTRPSVDTIAELAGYWMDIFRPKWPICLDMNPTGFLLCAIKSYQNV
jgi:hypothetical protein